MDVLVFFNEGKFVTDRRKEWTPSKEQKPESLSKLKFLFLSVEK